MAFLDTADLAGSINDTGVSKRVSKNCSFHGVVLSGNGGVFLAESIRLRFYQREDDLAGRHTAGMSGNIVY